QPFGFVDPVREGVINGVTRFVSEPGIRRSLGLPERTADPLLGLQGIPNYSNAIAEAMELVGTTLSSVQWHPRAVSVFSEVITLGMLSRAYYGESSLTLKQVAQFTGIFALILNSFVTDRH
ncbi:MAG TPA: hypothetical protein VFA32_12135, partial [Dehalococcoidia bacterium]|nr:hypothetical protein [Dehalococcoidia bacterium]